MYSINKEECTGCAACKDICPVGCIEMKSDGEGFLYPQIDHDRCISCGKCDKCCPVENFKPEYASSLHRAYVVNHKDMAIRKKSSSGGAFTLLAQYVLDRNGIVYGAVLDDSFNVIHMGCNSLECIEKIRGSKYVQSKTEGVYQEIKDYLEEGRYILFTGTPCQAEGLLCYLGKKYNNLITCDVACYGVSSPYLLAKYFVDKQNRENKTIKSVDFRSKKNGWRKWGTTFHYSDGTISEVSQYEDPFVEIYLSNKAMRYSCYSCKFRNELCKNSDVTIADCWGIEVFSPSMDDDKGSSIVFLNNEKMAGLWNELSKNAITKEVNIYRAILGNIGAFGKNKYVPKERRNIYEDIKTNDIYDMAEKYKIPKSKKTEIIARFPRFHRFYRRIKFLIVPMILKVKYEEMALAQITKN